MVYGTLIAVWGLVTVVGGIAVYGGIRPRPSWPQFARFAHYPRHRGRGWTVGRTRR
jgi:hypothetical protein